MKHLIHQARAHHTQHRFRLDVFLENKIDLLHINSKEVALSLNHLIDERYQANSTTLQNYIFGSSGDLNDPVLEGSILNKSGNTLFVVSEHLNHHAHDTTLNLDVFEFIFLCKDHDKFRNVLSGLQLIENTCSQFLEVN